MFCSFANLYNNTSKETITHLWFSICLPHMGFPCSLVSKESTYNAGAKGSIPGWERTPGEGNGNILQYSCLENPMNREAWWATVHGVARVRHDLATKPPNHSWLTINCFNNQAVSDSGAKWFSSIGIHFLTFDHVPRGSVAFIFNYTYPTYTYYHWVGW